jgi:hypothetical protein
MPVPPVAQSCTLLYRRVALGMARKWSCHHGLVRLVVWSETGKMPVLRCPGGGAGAGAGAKTVFSASEDSWVGERAGFCPRKPAAEAWPQRQVCFASPPFSFRLAWSMDVSLRAFPALMARWSFNGKRQARASWSTVWRASFRLHGEVVSHVQPCPRAEVNGVAAFAERLQH